MIKINHLFLGLILMLTSCAPPTRTAIPPTDEPTMVQATTTKRFQMLPTWTPSPTPPRKATPTPRNTSTPLIPPGGAIGSLVTNMPPGRSVEVLLDRPTYALLAKPANLVSMQYNPGVWMLNSYYPSSYMGYSLSNRSIFGCTSMPAAQMVPSLDWLSAYR